MKSKKRFLKLFIFCTFFIQFLTASQHELQLLSTHLLNLSLPPALSEIPVPHFINFNHTDLKKLILSQKPVKSLHGLSPINQTDKVQIVQLIVAWQDLSFTDFLAQPFTLERAYAPSVDTLQNNQTYSPRASIALIKLLQENNEDLKKALHTDRARTALATALSEDYGDPMLGGSSASCGYHTEKNSLLIANAIYSSTEEECVTEIKKILNISRFVLELFGLGIQNNIVYGTDVPGIWRSYMIAHPFTDLPEFRVANYDEAKNVTADWLHQSGLIALWEDDNAIKKLCDARKQEVLYHELYAHKKILPAPVIIGPGFRLEKSFVEEFKKEGTALRIFFINAFASNKTPTPGTNPNHWFALVINKVNTRSQYIILDSKNAPHYENETVSSIMAELSS